MNRDHRGTIFVEEATVVAHDHFDAAQHVLRIEAPRLAETARAGMFVHLSCDPSLAMRRPMSLMRCDPCAGWAELLYKEVGEGTRLLAGKQPGEPISVIGPIGVPFAFEKGRIGLLLGGGVGIPPMVFLAESMRAAGAEIGLVVMGSEVPFPFEAVESAMPVAGLERDVSAAMPLLERWKVPSRLASLQDFPGCFRGYVTDLGRAWLRGLEREALERVTIYACGPTPMLAASVELASEFDRPVQVSLEEFMACAVGGCAGCAVRIRTAHGPAMKRVCVDGPVFDGHRVLWD